MIYPLISGWHSQINSGAAFSADTADAPLPQPFIDETGGAADPGIDSDCRCRAVLRAGAALHAGVEIRNRSTFLCKREHLVWAYLRAPAAAGAGGLIQLQGCDVFKISESFHPGTPLEEPSRHQQNDADEKRSSHDGNTDSHLLLHSRAGGEVRAAGEVEGVKCADCG